MTMPFSPSIASSTITGSRIRTGTAMEATR